MKNLSWMGKLSLLQKRLLVVGTVGITLIILSITLCLFYNTHNQDVKLSEVFQGSQVVVSNSSIEMAGQYITKALTQEEKELALNTIIDQIGLKVTKNEFVQEKNGKAEILTVSKNSKQADTRIQLVSMNVNESGEIPVVQNYIMIHLKLYDQFASILEYKKLIEDSFEQLKLSEQSSYVQFVGHIPGKISIDSKNEMTDHMLKELGGKVMYEDRVNPMYTVYGYSSGIPEYISVGESKVNIQIAMNYNEVQDETMVYLATPILNGSY